MLHLSVNPKEISPRSFNTFLPFVRDVYENFLCATCLLKENFQFLASLRLNIFLNILINFKNWAGDWLLMFRLSHRGRPPLYFCSLPKLLSLELNFNIQYIYYLNLITCERCLSVEFFKKEQVEFSLNECVH